MKKLLLLFALCSSMSAWSQEIVSAVTADEVGAPVRRLEVVLSGNWLDGENVVDKTTMLIDLVMGYEDDAFNADKAFTEVTIKSAEGSTVTVNQSLVQQLVTGKNIAGAWYNSNNKIKRLDLSDVAVTHYVGHDGSASKNENATLYTSDSTCPIEYLAMPSFDTTVPGQTYTVPPYTISWMNELKELDLPKNAKTLESAAFADVNKLAYFHLNPGLEFIGNSAFWAKNQIPNPASGIDGMETLDVPSSVKYIGPGAFRFRNFTDLYFHSAQAPICPVGRSVVEGGDTEHPFIIDGNYMGFGGQNTTEGDDYKSGYANRNNYKNGDYWFTMVHFPSSTDVPGLDISSYKDETRVYNKVYGTLDSNPAWTGWDQNKIEMAVLGHEQEYIAREKNWYFAQPNDFVGKESEEYTYGTLSTMLAPTDKDQVPVDARGKGVVSSGYEDTFRGLNYIWPSQMQYERAYITVAKGYNWDGVTKYRPTLTPEQYALMVKDGLTVKQNGEWVKVGEDITYDEAKANAYNATLPNAVKEGDPKEKWTAEGAVEYNAGLEGAKKADDVYSYTDTEAYAYNANLNGAVKEGDVETTWTAADANTNNATLQGAWREGEEIHPTAEEVLAHNADFEGAKHEGDVEPGHDATWLSYSEYIKTTEWVNRPNQEGWWANQHDETAYNTMVSQCINDNNAWTYNGWPLNPITSAKVEGFTYTAEQAAAYNAAHNPKPWTTSTVLHTRTADEAIAHNATLDGAKHEGDPKTYYSADAAKQHNQTLEGAVNPGDHVTFTAETAAAYNATLNGAVKEGDTRSTYTAQEAIDFNKELPGNRKVGYTENTLDDPALKDVLSMLAFQSTRRCVFADNAGGGDNYNVNIPSSKEWWTICLPFDLTKAQIDKYFGVGTHVCKFNQVDRKIVTDEEGAAGQRSYVKFYFTDDQYVGKNADDVVLEAHEAYMIFPTVDEEDAVYIANGIPMTEYYKKTGNPNPTIVKATDNQEYRFVGNYDTKLPVVNSETGEVEIKDVVVPQYSYIYAKKSGATGKHPYQFWFTQNAGIKWGANKCIIQSTGADRGLTDNNTFFLEKQKGSEVKQITIFGYDEEDATSEETAIEEVIYVLGSGEDQQVIYNVNGMKLDTAPSKGVYIKNGKKYLAK